MTDLPFDVNTGEPRYGLEEPLQHLQTMLNQSNIDIETLDVRGAGQSVRFAGFEQPELQKITNIVDHDPEMKIRSGAVRNLNDKFDINLDTSDPNFIFRGDRMTRNNVALIQRGNESFVRDRDMFTSPPPVDNQQKIFDLLSSVKASPVKTPVKPVVKPVP